MDKMRLAEELQSAKQELLNKSQQNNVTAKTPSPNGQPAEVNVASMLDNNKRTAFVAKQIFSATTNITKTTNVSPASTIVNNVKTTKQPPPPVPPKRSDSVTRVHNAAQSDNTQTPTVLVHTSNGASINSDGFHSVSGVKIMFV
jgi:hypothetical protein